MSEVEPESKVRLWELIGKFVTAMLVTRTDGGRMRARPLSLASAHEGGKLYFATSLDSPKVEGQGDPALAIVEVTPREAEYWDQSGARGIIWALEMVKAYATRTTPESGASGSNRKVQL